MWVANLILHLNHPALIMNHELLYIYNAMYMKCSINNNHSHIYFCAMFFFQIVIIAIVYCWRRELEFIYLSLSSSIAVILYCKISSLSISRERGCILSSSVAPHSLFFILRDLNHELRSESRAEFFSKVHVEAKIMTSVVLRN